MESMFDILKRELPDPYIMHHEPTGSWVKIGAMTNLGIRYLLVAGDLVAVKDNKLSETGILTHRVVETRANHYRTNRDVVLESLADKKTIIIKL